MLTVKEKPEGNPVIIQFRDYGNTADDIISIWYTVYLNDEFMLDDLKNLISQVSFDELPDEGCSTMSFYEKLEECLIKNGVAFINHADSNHFLVYDV